MIVFSDIQGQVAGIVEDFFLKRTDRDIYTFLQEVLERPMVEKVAEKTNGKRFEATRMIESLCSEA